MKWILTVLIGGLVVLSSCNSEIDKVRAMEIEDVDLTKVSNGNYSGEFEYGKFTYRVAVKVENNKMVEITVLTNRDTEYAKKAEVIIEQVMKSQSLAVDAKTGATTTTKALLKCLENALKSAIQ